MSSKFTILIDVYWGLPLFKKALGSIQNQTYKNIEIIIANNGASNEITQFIKHAKDTDSRIKVLHYKDNLFSFDDPEIRSFVIFNDALKIASGDYFFHQSYDDLMALDYVERMVNLFEENPRCTSAAGIFVSIDENDNVNQDELLNRKGNFRPRFMPGHEMVLGAIRYGKKIFSAPGEIFTFKRDFLINYGGFHRAVEYAQLYGVVPFGETGFDEKAIFYWRRHDQQMNRVMYIRGCSGIKDFYSMLDDFKIEERWSVFGKDIAKRVVKTTSQQVCQTAAQQTIIFLFGLNLRGFFRSFSESAKRYYYWKALPKIFWIRKKYLLLIFAFQFKFFIRPIVNFLYLIVFKKQTKSGILFKLHRFFNLDRLDY